MLDNKITWNMHILYYTTAASMYIYPYIIYKHETTVDTSVKVGISYLMDGNRFCYVF